jgi:hypothetical protein
VSTRVTFSRSGINRQKILLQFKENIMAKIKDNLLVRGARGNVGKQFVYKKRGNDTHIARMPVVKKDAVVTEKQEQVRELFAAATQYAKGAITNPDLKREYEKKATAGNTAYNMALRDFLKAPKVKDIDTGKYNGTVGSIISVKAKDDFRVTEVLVSIRTATGELVETGNAILNPLNLNKWVYTATQNNAALAGSIITATARDLAENSGVLEVTL